MSKKKERYLPKPFESDGNRSDTSANIYHSMLLSPRWQALTKGAKVLYLYCKAQYYAEKTKPAPKNGRLTETEKLLTFTMNEKKWHDIYGIYSNKLQFYKDMLQLVQAGFIDIIENGKVTRSKNVYIFSTRWRE